MNSVTRISQRGVPQVGSTMQTPQGPMTWDGSQWCSCCPDDSTPPFPCPPPGWPPPGCPPWFSGQNSPPWYPGANAGVSFGTTPPPNPVRGHFWWDGITLWMFDGAAWVAAGGGSAGQGAASVAIGPNPPVAPQPGALWFDGAMLLLWTGTAWIPTEGNATGASPPPNPSDGMLWWNGSTLMVWDGVAWVPVSQTKSYIQATAPPSANPGDTWWDGTQMRIWDGTAWNLIGPGSTVGPVPTSTDVLAISNSGYLTAPTTWGIVAFTGTPTIDTMTGFDPVTRKYTPKKAGVYMFQCTAWGGGGQGIAILYNDTGSFSDTTTDPVLCIQNSQTAGHLQSNALRKMNGTTDYVRLFGYCTTGQLWGAPAPPMLGAWLLP